MLFMEVTVFIALKLFYAVWGVEEPIAFIIHHCNPEGALWNSLNQYLFKYYLHIAGSACTINFSVS